MTRKRCACHSDRSLYGSLIECPRCHHWSNDRGIGCERRKCGWVDPELTKWAASRTWP